ncbi:MAG: NAD-dependent epimerase/dehydratase family protein [Desulfobacteraceae bacterium]|nr:MAG: NAD-dependent epimerase/dehydratase family protein [Desulfobacteraceae bacterium]
MKILVTGAAGYVGGEIVKHLCDKKWVDSVVGMDINDHGFKHLKYTFEIRDIRESMDDIFKTDSIDTVVHAAYVLPPIHNKNLMEDINRGGTKNVLKASAKAGVKQILYTSSTTAYGFYPDNDQPLTEESPLRGNDDMTYAKNKKEIEAIMAQFMKEHPDIIVSILRPCFVVGPGFKNPLAEHLKKKLVLLPSNGKQFQYVHEDDVTNVTLLLLEKRIGGIFNVTGDGIMTFSEMTKMLGNIRIPLPWPVIYPLNNLAWFLRLGFITQFPSPAMRLMVTPWIASSEKLKRETGYTFKYDTRSAFADFVRSVKK